MKSMAYSLAAILVAGLTLTQTACGADSGDNPDQATSQTDQSQASDQAAQDDSKAPETQAVAQAEPETGTAEPDTGQTGPAAAEDETGEASAAQAVAAGADTPEAAAKPDTTRKTEPKTEPKPAAVSKPADQAKAPTQTADAEPADNNQKQAAGGPEAAEKLARSTIDKLLTEIERRKAELKQNPEALYTLIERVLIPAVDVQYLSEQVLGKHWNNASEQQRKRFTKLFTRMVTETYGNALYGFEREQLEFQPLDAPADATDVTFRAQAKTDRGDSVPVNLAMHKTDSGWKIYDATVDTLSLISSYRSQFNSQLSAGGMEQLLEKMEQRYGSG